MPAKVEVRTNRKIMKALLQKAEFSIELKLIHDPNIK